MAVEIPTQSVIARFLAGLATPRLFLVALALFGLDLLIPDLIPFVDEALLAILTLIFARKKSGVTQSLTDHGPLPYRRRMSRSPLMHYRRFVAPVVALAVATLTLTLEAGNQPARARRAMVVSQSDIASEAGWKVMREGGNAVDGAVATALALAVTHPTAGNIGGGGFIVYRAADGTATTFDFREMAPAGSNPTMWMKDGKYDFDVHHNSHRSVGVPGTVAGLHLAWQKLGSKPWKDLVLPAVALARDGFEVSEGLAQSLAEMLVEPDDFKKYPASLAQFSKNGQPYQPGDILKQPDLARSLQRIADQGPAGFYEGETAALIEKEMKANNGLITREDLKNYRAKERAPIKGTYRGVEVIGMPPPSSGGIAVVHMLNLLEGFDLKANGYGSAQNLHLVAESMRRAFADRAQHLGDPDFNTSIPVAQLISKDYAAQVRKTINPNKASVSSPSSFSWPTESQETTHLSVVDEKRNAVSMTYTLEYSYGSRIVVPGAGFLLNNEMGDFNSAPGDDRRARQHRHAAEPRPARQAHALEHVAVDPGPRRQAVHGDGVARRPHHHQHGADDHPQRRRLRHERAGSGGRRPDAPPVAARSAQHGALRLLGRHHREAEGDGPYRERAGPPGRGRGDRRRQGRHPRRRPRPPGARRRRRRQVQSAPAGAPWAVGRPTGSCRDGSPHARWRSVSCSSSRFGRRRPARVRRSTTGTRPRSSGG